MALFGVFDGHGLAGRYASVYACARVAAYVQQEFPAGCGGSLSKEQVEKKIKSCFTRAHKDMMESVVECESREGEGCAVCRAVLLSYCLSTVKLS